MSGWLSWSGWRRIGEVVCAPTEKTGGGGSSERRPTAAATVQLMILLDFKGIGGAGRRCVLCPLPGRPPGDTHRLPSPDRP